MRQINEIRIYRKALREAKEHVRRWKELGRRLHKTNHLAWQAVLSIRQAAVKQLESLIQLAKNRS